MPRTARLDAPGVLHHIMMRGIERRPVFRSDQARQDLLERLPILLPETKTACYAWAFLPNHAHFLFRSGPAEIPSLMRRLLTGYAVSFDRWHRRHGQLFQNRYKSVLCEEGAYLLELVRYIHLNPLRAGLVADYEELCRYPYGGHSVILGHGGKEWQAVGYVLGLFAEKRTTARHRYLQFVQEGIDRGKRPDLIGGGLLRSQGGWTGVKALRAAGTYQKGDERILGNGNFVSRVLAGAQENLERKYRLAAAGYNLDRLIHRVAELLGIAPEEVMGPGKARQRVKARSLLCYWANTELGIPQSLLAQRLALKQPAVSNAVRRGERLARQRKYAIEKA